MPLYFASNSISKVMKKAIPSTPHKALKSHNFAAIKMLLLTEFLKIL